MVVWKRLELSLLLKRTTAADPEIESLVKNFAAQFALGRVTGGHYRRCLFTVRVRTVPLHFGFAASRDADAHYGPIRASSRN